MPSAPLPNAATLASIISASSGIASAAAASMTAPSSPTGSAGLTSSSSSVTTISSVTTSPSTWTHERVPHFGSRLSVVDFGDKQLYFIGTQVAALLKRETFNMYRSMKIKLVDLERATSEQVDFLCQVGAVRSGTHSVTLIPYQEGLYFIADAWIRQHKFELVYSNRARSRTKSFMIERPKLHRRKPHPWNVHRALKREDLSQIDGDSLTLRCTRRALTSSTDSAARAEPTDDLLASLLQHTDAEAHAMTFPGIFSSSYTPSPTSAF